MIFSIGDHIQQIINGTKTQTRRLLTLDSRMYHWLQDYAIQPRRGKKGISEGRIKIVYFDVEHKVNGAISVADALAEGGYTPEEYETLFEEIYPDWSVRIVYRFKFIPHSSSGSVKNEAK